MLSSAKHLHPSSAHCHHPPWKPVQNQSIDKRISMKVHSLRGKTWYFVATCALLELEKLDWKCIPHFLAKNEKNEEKIENLWGRRRVGKISVIPWDGKKALVCLVCYPLICQPNRMRINFHFLFGWFASDCREFLEIQQFLEYFLCKLLSSSK